MKYPMTVKAFQKFMTFHEQLGRELRTRTEMRYGRTLRLLEAMNALFIEGRSWERRKSQDAKRGRHEAK